MIDSKYSQFKLEIPLGFSVFTFVYMYTTIPKNYSVTAETSKQARREEKDHTSTDLSIERWFMRRPHLEALSFAWVKK